MKLTLTVALIAGLVLSACNKSQTKSQAEMKPSDAVQAKLLDIAGMGATNCGAPKTQDKDAVQPATDCAMKAAQSKQAFYVRYDLPGMTTAMAGDGKGQLYAVQSEANGQIQSTPCPADIRVAQSGRVTCYAAGSMGGMGTMGGTSLHGGMSMPPATGPNPHDGTAMPSHGTPHEKPQKP
ncbi:MAG TPA: hypothetical protein VFU86_17095 [Terriglobales bacterium]|nr:hypothetical protein [Terriglobales bacterium]